jgi:hypothetical protein
MQSHARRGVRGHLHVHRQHEHLEAGALRALHERRDDRRVAGQVRLEPRGRADFLQLLQRNQRRAALDHDRVELRRDFGEHSVAIVGGEGSPPHRREAERQIVGAPEDRRLLVAGAGVDQHARQEVVLREGGAVAVERCIRFHGARDVAEDGPRQVAARRLLEVVEAQYVLQMPRRLGLLTALGRGAQRRLVCLRGRVVHGSLAPVECRFSTGRIVGHARAFGPEAFLHGLPWVGLRRQTAKLKHQIPALVLNTCW